MATYIPSFTSAREETNPHINLHKPKSISLSFSSFSHHDNIPKVETSHGGKNIVIPSFEIRESRDDYFLEGEFPGVGSEEHIKAEWTASRTLLVEANVPQVDLEEEWGIVLARTNTSADTKWNEPPSLHEWTRERHTGHFLRTFTFPHDVQQETLKARLTNGLLKMVVSKDTPVKEPQQVPIEITEGL